METQYQIVRMYLSCQCSYRTYEEWKHSIKKAEATAIDSSYRTYEEWKPRKTSIDAVPGVCSYRTYEEWKQL